MKKKFDPKAFSLVLKHGDKTQIIEIPQIDSKWSVKKTIGGKQTYQMAIDAFTTNFQNEEELFNWLIQNHQIPADDKPGYRPAFHIEYKGEEPFPGKTTLVFSDNTELIDFIQNNPISSSFVADYFRDDSYVSRFKTEIIERSYCREDSQEYRKFMTNPNEFYGDDLVQRLEAFLPTDEIITFDGLIPEFCEYHNIRGHFIANNNGSIDHRLEEIQNKQLKQDFNRYTPFNELGEEENRKTRRSFK